MTAQEILAKLEELNVSNSNFHYEDYDKEPFGEVEQVDCWGGEGEGERIGSVTHFVDHNVYLRIDGYYASHYGSDWDNKPYEVTPKEKTITVFE